jgi:hypothetical protein
MRRIDSSGRYGGSRRRVLADGEATAAGSWWAAVKFVGLACLFFDVFRSLREFVSETSLRTESLTMLISFSRLVFVARYKLLRTPVLEFELTRVATGGCIGSFPFTDTWRQRR